MDIDLDTLAQNVHEALRAWQSKRRYASPLRGLILIEQKLRVGESEAAATQQVLASALQILAGYAPDQAELLRTRFEEGTTMAVVARQKGWSEANLFQQQKKAIVELARIIRQQEKVLRESRESLLMRDLTPSANGHLVGVEAKIATLRPYFSERNAPWMLALEGMGGIGKTSLADAFARQLVLDGTMDRVLWVSAKQNNMTTTTGKLVPTIRPSLLTPEALIDFLVQKLLEREAATWDVPEFEQIEAIREELQKRPHLLVVDNLESAPNLADLLPFLRQLVAPTKILLTTRVQLIDEGDIIRFAVPALSVAETHALLLQEAGMRLNHSLQNCDLATATRIYNAVGGNPLAIRLVAGQIYLYGIEMVLDDLQHASGAAEELYEYLYGWTWEHLSEEGRAVLLAMVAIPEDGSTLDELGIITKHPVRELRPILEHLITQNIIEVQPHPTHPLFTIHNLTRSFMQKTILKW